MVNPQYKCNFCEFNCMQRANMWLHIKKDHIWDCMNMCNILPLVGEKRDKFGENKGEQNGL